MIRFLVLIEIPLNSCILFLDIAVNIPTEFTVDTRAVSKPKIDDGKLACSITNPSGGKTEKTITPQEDGTYRVSYTPFEEGPHVIDILYDNVPVPASPFSVNVKRICDPTKCKAYGPGLKKGIVDKVNKFTVETSGKSTSGRLIIVMKYSMPIIIILLIHKTLEMVVWGLQSRAPPRQE